MKPINLQGARVALALVIVALLAQMPHAASLFHRLAPAGEPAGVSWLHATVFAIAVESATLFFVIRGKKVAAYLFATASVAINLAYYQIWTATEYWTTASIVLVSAILPIAIAAYSHFAATGAQTAPPAPKQAKSTTSKPKAQKPPAEAVKARKEKALSLYQSDPTLSNSEIAREIGVSRTSVAKYLNGVRS